MRLLVSIILLLNIGVQADIKNRFPIKNLNEIIKLEKTIKPEITSMQSVLVSIDQIEIFKNDYILVDCYKSKRINAFSKSGRYIKTLNKHGAGPKEFKQPIFIMNNSTDELIAFGFPPNKMLKFNNNYEITEEKRAGTELTKVYESFAVKHNDNYIIHGSQGKKETNIIFVTDRNFNHLFSFRPLEPLSRIMQFGFINIIVAKETLWVSRMYDPYIDIFSLKTGELIKTIGKNRKRYSHCFYSDNLSDQNNKKNLLTALVKEMSKKDVPNNLINLDNQLILHGSFYKKDSTGKRRRYFDIYDLEGNLLQKQVELKQKFNNEGDTYHNIPKTSVNRLFLISTNLTEDEEEKYSNIIYQYTVAD